jgi:hypothetical protein
MSELRTYHGASTIMRKTLDWNVVETLRVSCEVRPELMPTECICVCSGDVMCLCEARIEFVHVILKIMCLKG